MSSLTETNTTPSFTALELLPLSVIKTHCRVDYSLDDAYLTTLAAVSLELAESETKRPIARREFYYVSDTWSSKYLLTHTHKTVLNKVEYLKTDGTRNTLWTSGSTFRVTADDYVRNAMYEQGLPTDFESIIITYTGGYSSTQDVPRGIVQGCLALIAHYYEQRSVVSADTLNRVPHGMRYLFTAFKKHLIL